MIPRCNLFVHFLLFNYSSYDCHMERIFYLTIHKCQYFDKLIWKYVERATSHDVDFVRILLSISDQIFHFQKLHYLLLSLEWRHFLNSDSSHRKRSQSTQRTVYPQYEDRQQKQKWSIRILYRENFSSKRQKATRVLWLSLSANRSTLMII